MDKVNHAVRYAFPTQKVSFIMLHLNQEEATRECIKSLLNLSYNNVEIILVDNGSADGSGMRLSNEFPSVIFTRNEQNLGFAEGNNVGMRLALLRGADYVVLLNNDTVVEQDFVQPLLHHAASDPTIGVQSCKIYYYADPKKLWYAGGLLHVDKAEGYHIGYLEEDSGKYNILQDTEFATGCMMFLSRKALEDVGLLEKSYFIYFEDSDWSIRARRLGYRVIYNPRAKLLHKVSLSTSVDSPFYLYFMTRNKILFVRKHSHKFSWIIHLPYFINYYGRYILKHSLRMRSLRSTYAIIAGIVDGLRNFTGENGEGSLPKI